MAVTNLSTVCVLENFTFQCRNDGNGFDHSWANVNGGTCEQCRVSVLSSYHGIRVDLQFGQARGHT
jgi:hypothetical protein